MTIMRHSLEKSGEVSVEGGNIHYRYYEPHDLEKTGRTPIVVVHGGPGASHVMMYDALCALADERPALFYDQLGSYFSPAEVTQDLMRVDRFADEILRLLDALNLKKAVLLGHSWGAAVIAAFALQYCERVEGLILSCPFLSTKRWIDDCNELLKALPADAQAAIHRCEAEGTTDSEEYKAADKLFFARYMCRLEKMPDLWAKHSKQWNPNIYNAMWGPSEFTCMGLLKDFDLFPRLPEIKVPTAIICGEFDTATPKTMKIVQSLINGSTLKVIPGSGHLAFLDGNEAYVAAVLETLASHP
ncbi:MAG: proline iminopeptidase-family hydrolase [Alphaproteobacteria bacterium]|nr:proline iminopeptidase-family hydrolase [Alphaproteobacteria bacterium]